MTQDYPENQDIVDRILYGKKHWGALGIVFVNILVFLVVEFTGSSVDNNHMLEMGASYGPLVMEGQWWRLFASMFLHFGISHLFNNLLMLLFLGDTLESLVGFVRYLIICLGGGLAGSLLSLFMEIRGGEYFVSAGASGCAFALMGAMLWILIRERGPVEELTLRRLAIYAGLSLYSGIANPGVDFYAHLGGLAGGFFLALVFYRSKYASEEME